MLAMTLEQELQDLEIQMMDPAARRSPESFAHLLADDFVEFGSSGRAYDKQQVLDALRRETTPREFTVEGFTARELASHIVLVTYRVSVHIHGGAETAHSLRSSIWMHRGGRWQIVFHQGTPIAA